MGFIYFIFGILVGIWLIAALPLLLATLGLALALGIALTVPLLAAVLFFLGILAAIPALGYGLAIAALLILLWASERKRRQPSGRR
jgi:hypothetical protein